MTKEAYFENLKSRLFDYMTSHGVFEPQAGYFLCLLAQSSDVKNRLNSNGIYAEKLALSMNVTMVMTNNSLGTSAARMKGEAYFPANLTQKSGSLSKLFNDKNIAVPLDIEALHRAYNEFMESDASKPVRALIERILSDMDDEGTEIIDVNLLQSILEYDDLPYSAANILKLYGVDKDSISADYNGHTVYIAIPRVH